MKTFEKHTTHKSRSLPNKFWEGKVATPVGLVTVLLAVEFFIDSEYFAPVSDPESLPRTWFIKN